MLEMGHERKYTRVKEAMREFIRVKQEMFIPLIHRTRVAQVDFGYALAIFSGVLRKVGFFVIMRPCSDALFVRLLSGNARKITGEGYVQAFECFGGGPNRISYGYRVLGSKILDCRDRTLTDGLLKLQN